MTNTNLLPKAQEAKSVKTCPRCHGTNTNFQLVAEQKKRGILMSLVWLALGVCTIGVALIIAKLIRKGSKTRSYGLCQDCGHKWRA